ncbi:hypothetical protein [Halanaerobaculum tunisiense]
MVANNKKLPMVSNDPNLTEEEIDFLMQNIDELKQNDSMGENEEQLISFLKKQLNKMKQAKEKEQLEGIRINSNHQEDIKKILKKRTGEFIIINLMIGGDCCQVEGVLSDINTDFISLIKQGEVIQIKIEAIGAIIKKNSSLANEETRVSANNTKQKYNDQYHLEDENDQVSKQDSELKINKQQKAYTEIEE